MAVEKTRIIGRLRALFPKANLSTNRLNELADRLSKKPADDADDAAIDVILNDANDVYPFMDIAKGDDKIRDLEAKAKKPAGDDPKEPKEIELPDDTPEWAKALLKQNQELAGKLQGFEASQQHKTIAEKFASDERVKNIPASIRDKFIPSDETKMEDAITELTAAFTPYAQAAKAGGFGKDAPGSGGQQRESDGKVDPDIVKYAQATNEAAKTAKV